MVATCNNETLTIRISTALSTAASHAAASKGLPTSEYIRALIELDLGLRIDWTSAAEVRKAAVKARALAKRVLTQQLLTEHRHNMHLAGVEALEASLEARGIRP